MLKYQLNVDMQQLLNSNRVIVYKIGSLSINSINNEHIGR